MAEAATWGWRKLRPHHKSAKSGEMAEVAAAPKKLQLGEMAEVATVYGKSYNQQHK